MNRLFCKRLHNGCFMYVDPSEHIQQSIFWYGYYEKEAVLTWENMARNQQVVLDIGANTGYYTLIAAPQARQVYAFEPSSHAMEYLKKNIQLNQFRNISLNSDAASDATGQATFYISGEDNAGMSGLAMPENFTGKTETIHTIRLDEWVTANNIASIDLVKIDVEGAELKVLSGMEKLIAKHRPPIFIEVMDELLTKFGASAGDVYRFFSSLDYQGYEIIKPNMLKPVDGNKQAYTILFLHRDFVIPQGIVVVRG